MGRDFRLKADPFGLGIICKLKGPKKGDGKFLHLQIPSHLQNQQLLPHRGVMFKILAKHMLCYVMFKILAMHIQCMLY